MVCCYGVSLRTVPSDATSSAAGREHHAWTDVVTTASGTAAAHRLFRAHLYAAPASSLHAFTVALLAARWLPLSVTLAAALCTEDPSKVRCWRRISCAFNASFSRTCSPRVGSGCSRLRGSASATWLHHRFTRQNIEEQFISTFAAARTRGISCAFARFLLADGGSGAAVAKSWRAIYISYLGGPGAAARRDGVHIAATWAQTGVTRYRGQRDATLVGGERRTLAELGTRRAFPFASTIYPALRQAAATALYYWRAGHLTLVAVGLYVGTHCGAYWREHTPSQSRVGGDAVFATFHACYVRHRRACAS